MQKNLMRTCLITVATLTLPTISMSAAEGQTAPSSELKVTGIIRPVACSLALGNGTAAVVSYDQVPRSQLRQSSVTKLDAKEIDFRITCDGPIRMSVRATDSSTGKLTGMASQISPAVTEDAMFGLGVADGSSAQIGAFHFAMKPDSFSGKGSTDETIRLRTISRTRAAEGSRWSVIADGSISTLNELSWAAQSADGPHPLMSINGKLSVQAVINRADALPAAQEINLRGAATIEMRYL